MNLKLSETSPFLGIQKGCSFKNDDICPWSSYHLL